MSFSPKRWPQTSFKQVASYQRQKYVYSRKDIHLTRRFSLVGFYGVQVTVTHDYITTEGALPSTPLIMLFEEVVINEG